MIKAGGKLAVVIRLVKTNTGLEIKQAYMKGPDGETIELTEIISGEYRMLFAISHYKNFSNLKTSAINFLLNRFYNFIFVCY